MPVVREMSSAARNVALRVVDFFCTFGPSIYEGLNGFIFEVCKWKLLNY